jgi:hypothetical protein
MKRSTFAMNLPIVLDRLVRVIIVTRFTHTLWHSAEKDFILCWLSPLLESSSEIDADSSLQSSTAALSIGIMHGPKTRSIQSLTDSMKRMRPSLVLRA